jgi:hypothetical protein
MNSLIYRLGLYLEARTTKNKERLRSHFYRHAALLSLPLQKVFPLELTSEPRALRLCTHLADYGPLNRSDLDQEFHSLFLEWDRKFPKDPAFFKKALYFQKVLKQHAPLTLREFFATREGRLWMRSRKRLKRRPCYEWDQSFKASKAKSLNDKLWVRNLLRKNPLLRLEDLKAMAVPNAQAHWEGFPFLKTYRQEYLRQLSERLVRAKVD